MKIGIKLNVFEAQDFHQLPAILLNVEASISFDKILSDLLPEGQKVH
jgi:hypothetical protein